jgi:predicted metal-dependent enzyme (double-stranded beta helix superfamily)
MTQCIMGTRRRLLRAGLGGLAALSLPVLGGRYRVDDGVLDIEALIDRCVAAAAGPRPLAAVTGMMREAFADPDAVRAALGVANRPGFEPILRGKSFSLFNVAWAPGMALPAHDHGMWSVTAVYHGEEHSLLWREAGAGLEVLEEKRLGAGDVLPLSRDAIHSVDNPGQVFCCALHAYGGDYHAAARRLWDKPEDAPRYWDGEAERGWFEDYNRRHYGDR